MINEEYQKLKNKCFIQNYTNVQYESYDPELMTALFLSVRTIKNS